MPQRTHSREQVAYFPPYGKARRLGHMVVNWQDPIVNHFPRKKPVPPCLHSYLLLSYG
jgi:hypothetical protein